MYIYYLYEIDDAFFQQFGIPQLQYAALHHYTATAWVRALRSWHGWKPQSCSLEQNPDVYSPIISHNWQ